MGIGGRGWILRRLSLVLAVASAVPAAATAGQSSQPSSVAAGHITAGKYHSCARLADGSVRCWGYGGGGALGYGNTNTIGDGETPASVGAVNVGFRRTVQAISAGSFHTCAVLDDGTVRCWGFGGEGRLGYGNTNSIGASQTPGSLPPVDLAGHKALAISAGGAQTCALLDDHTVRCWGFGTDGRLGYGNRNRVGDGAPGSPTPATAGPVDLGARAISAGGNHTCAVLDDGSVRCWGLGLYGQLGYGNTSNVGDTQTPASTGPVALGPGRTAVAISAGELHTCALLDDGNVRCWGDGANGRLGYCNVSTVGDLLTPGSVGPINLRPGDGGALCAGAPGPPKTGKHPELIRALRAEATRRRGLLKCLRAAARRPKVQRQAADTRCVTRFGRTPGRIARPKERAVSRTAIILTFSAPGSDGTHPPAARAYLVKQSRSPIRSPRDFRQAATLCNGSCRFRVAAVGTTIKLTITHLAPHTIYYYAIAARDNISNILGPRSQTIAIRTR